ncbi:unnamed protein product, partial [Urochloa humidicola]
LARSSRFQPFPSRKPPRSWGEQDGRGGSEMAKSCKGLAMELVKCLSETDCVKVQKMPYKDCAGEKVPNITSECVGLRETYNLCKVLDKKNARHIVRMPELTWKTRACGTC